jgi:hypothetical protein
MTLLLAVVVVAVRLWVFCSTCFSRLASRLTGPSSWRSLGAAIRRVALAGREAVVPARRYGVAVSDEKNERSLGRLRARRTPESLWAAATFTREARRDAHAEIALIAKHLSMKL